MKSIINGKFIMIIGIIMTFVAPVLLTSNSCCDIFDFTTTGQIGDTIGGITAPIVGFVSVILLYLTLKEQQRFNTQQATDNRINQVLAIQSDLNSFSDKTLYKYKLDNQEVKGCGIINLAKLARINSSFSFDYIEMAELFQSCILARVMCEQIKEFSNELDSTSRNSFNSFICCYLISLKKFLSVISRKNITGNIFDSVTDEGNNSEIDNLLYEITAEVHILEEELKHYK